MEWKHAQGDPHLLDKAYRDPGGSPGIRPRTRLGGDGLPVNPAARSAGPGAAPDPPRQQEPGLSRIVYWLLGLAALASTLPALVGSLWRRLGVHRFRLTPPGGRHPARQGVPCQDVTFLTADGLLLSAWHTPPQNGAVILVGHGYADVRSPELHATLARHGYGVLSWDFRAHGKSEGTLCTMGYHEALDVEAALDFALAQPEVEWVGLWGGSMGGIAGIRVAAHRPEIRALALDSVPATVEAAVEITVRPAALRSLVQYVSEREGRFTLEQLRSIDQIGSISPRPLFIMQGTADKLIPVDSGQRLYDAAGEARSLWIVPGAGHLVAHYASQQAYQRRVIGFFDGALQEDQAQVGSDKEALLR